MHLACRDFSSALGLLTTAAALNYPIAIVLPRGDSDAIGLGSLHPWFADAFCVLTALMLSSFDVQILSIVNAEAIAPFIYLILVAIFISVLVAISGQWLIRKKAFGVTFRCLVIKSLIETLSKSGLASIINWRCFNTQHYFWCTFGCFSDLFWLKAAL